MSKKTSVTKTKGAAASGGFVNLRVRVDSRVPFAATFFIKQHITRKVDPALPSDRTLFVANAGHLHEDALRRVFEEFGPVESVKIGRLGGEDPELVEKYATMLDEFSAPRVATVHVVFDEAISLKAAMKGRDSDVVVDGDEDVTGMQAWISEHRAQVVDPAKLQKDVDVYFAEFDRLEQEAREQRMKPQVDEDGFTLVQHKNTRKRLAEEDPVLAAGSRHKKKKKKDKHLVDFYRFQKREAKRDEIAALRLKFEKDKERIAKMKAQRKFKPMT